MMPADQPRDGMARDFVTIDRTSHSVNDPTTADGAAPQILDAVSAELPDLRGAYKDKVEIGISERSAILYVPLKRRMALYAKRDFGLNIIEARLVMMIGHYGPISVNALAEHSGIDRTAARPFRTFDLRIDCAHSLLAEEERAALALGHSKPFGEEET